MSMKRNKKLKRRALRINQNKNSPLYLLSLTGEDILQLADISRISRDDAGKLLGYQRPEIRRHIDEIVQYLNSEDILFPNSIILAFTSRVRFVASRGPNVSDGYAAAGTLELPFPSPGEAKPGWIVDGQQRVLAISKSNRLDFPVPVSAFIAETVDLQRDQFLRINNTRSLPRGLITELLPEVTTTLPPRLAARKIPSAICDLLNRSEDSQLSSG